VTFFDDYDCAIPPPKVEKRIEEGNVGWPILTSLEIVRSQPHSGFCDVRVDILTFDRWTYCAPFQLSPTLSSRPEQIIAKR